MTSSFRIGRETFTLVRRNAVRRPRSRAEALSILQRTMQTERELAVLRQLLERQHVNCFALAREELLDTAAEQLVRGHLVLVLQQEAPRLLDQPTVRNLADLIEPAEPASPRPSEPEQAPTFIEVVLVDDQGRGVDAQYVLSLDGKPAQGEFAEAELLRVDPVGEEAIATLRLEQISVPMQPLPMLDAPSSPTGGPTVAPEVEAPTSVTVVDESGTGLSGTTATLLVDGEVDRELQADGSKNDLGVLPAGSQYTLRLAGLNAT